MKNFRLTIQYDGGRYNGWQRQGNTDKTIQGKLEQILSRMAEHTVTINGAGRTDAGVHAQAQIASFQLETALTAQQVMHYLNTYLPADIAVTACDEMPERFHARLHAMAKCYRYRLCDGGVPDVFTRRYVCAWPRELNLEVMRIAAGQLMGTHDFRAFSSVNKRYKKSTVRTITRLDIRRVGAEVQFLFEGTGFLYHMVRILTGTLVEVGEGKRDPHSMQTILDSLDRQQAGMMMPPHGLILEQVLYDK